MMILLLWLTQSSHAQDSTADPRIILQRVADAYSDRPSLRITLSRGSIFLPGVPDILADRVPKAPETSVLLDPVSQQPVYFLEETTITIAGSALVKQSRSLALGGNRDRTISTTVWDSALTHSRLPLGSIQAQTDFYDEFSYDGLVELRDRGRVGGIHIRAGQTSWDTTRYNTFILTNADDTQLVRTTPDGMAVIRSDAWGIQITADPHTGEVHEDRSLSRDGSVRVQQVYEWSPHAVFPARLPQILRIGSVESFDAPLERAGLVIIESVKQLDSVDNSIFDWWTYAKTTHDRTHDRVLGPGNVPLDIDPPKPPDLSKALMVPDPNAPDGVRIQQPQRPIRTVTRWLIPVGGSFLVIAVILWIRRRVSTT